MAELASLKVADEPAAWEALGFAVAGSAVCVGGVRISLVGRAAGVGILEWSLRGVSDGSSSLDGLATVSVSAGEHRDEGDEPRAGAIPAGEHRDEGVAVGVGAASPHLNGALALDHVVAFTPAFSRTRDVLVAAGLDLRREAALRDTSMAFFRIGPTILELVAKPDDRSGFANLRGDASGPASPRGDASGPASPHGDASGPASPRGEPLGPARFWGLVVVLPSVDEVHAGLAAHLGEPRDAVQPGRRIATVRDDAGVSPALAFMTPRA